MVCGRRIPRARELPKDGTQAALVKLAIDLPISGLVLHYGHGGLAGDIIGYSPIHSRRVGLKVSCERNELGGHTVILVLVHVPVLHNLAGDFVSLPRQFEVHIGSILGRLDALFEGPVAPSRGGDESSLSVFEVFDGILDLDGYCRGWLLLEVGHPLLDSHHLLFESHFFDSFVLCTGVGCGWRGERGRRLGC